MVEEYGMALIICEKGHRNHLLIEEQKKWNRQKSKTRCRIEYIFGFTTVHENPLTFQKVTN